MRRQRCVPPWTNYVVRTKHWRKMFTTSDNANWSPISEGDGSAGSLATLKREIKLIPEGFKPPSLAMFDGRINPYEHVCSINTHIAIIRMPDSLKYKILYGTFMEVALWWYMGIPCASIANYQELINKLVHQFTVIRHRKMSTTILFNIWQNTSESLRDYLARFNEATIRVIPPNQEMFVGELQNALKEGHFNKSHTYKLALS